MQWIVSRWSLRPSSCVCHTTWCCIIRGHTQAAGLFDFVSLSLYFLWREQEKDRDRKIIRRKKILVKLRIQYSFRFRSRETVILVQQNQRRDSFLPINPDVRLEVYVTSKKVNDPLPAKRQWFTCIRDTQERKRGSEGEVSGNRV